MSKCNFNHDVRKAEIFANNIRNLQYLKSYYLDTHFFYQFHIPLPTNIPLSLENLSITSDLFYMNDLIRLFRRTSNLKSLDLIIRDQVNNDQFLCTNSSLVKLKIDIRGSFDVLNNLLKNLPNLSELIIQIEGVYIDGYQWEQIITQYLTKLKVFRLLMFYAIDREKHIEQEIEQLIKSFQTKFWLKERQWFVRCGSEIEYKFLCLYTLPYEFKNFDRISRTTSNSRCTNDRHCIPSKYVNKISIHNSLLKSVSQFPLKFSNIHHLELYFPFDDTFSSIVTNFDRLISIELVSTIHSNDIDQAIINLRSLLNRATRLYSITMDYLIMSQLSLVKLENKSIRRIDLIENDGHFYGLECISLIQSLLGDQCEVLLINIEHRSILLDLIEKLANLRALTFQCQDDLWEESNESSLQEDEIIQWLKHNLSSNCVISRDESELSAIRLWIR